MITQLSRAGRNQNLHLDEGAQLILERSEYKFRFALMGNATMLRNFVIEGVAHSGPDLQKNVKKPQV